MCDRHWIRLPGARAARCALMATMANAAEYALYLTTDQIRASRSRPASSGSPLPRTLIWRCTCALCRARPPRLHGLHLLWLEGDAEDAAVPDKAADINLPHYGGLERRSFVFSPRAPSRDAQARAGTPCLTHLKAIPRPPTRRLTGTSALPALTPAPACASRAAPPPLASAQGRDSSNEAEKVLRRSSHRRTVLSHQQSLTL